MHINLHFLHHHHHNSVTHLSTGSKERLINPRTFLAIRKSNHHHHRQFQLTSSVHKDPKSTIGQIQSPFSASELSKQSVQSKSVGQQLIKMNDWDLQSNQTASGESDLSITFLQITGQNSSVSDSSAANSLLHWETANVAAQPPIIPPSNSQSTNPTSFPISIDFLFYVPVPADPPAANTQKRSQPRNAPPPPPKTKKVQSESDKIVIDWPASSNDIKAFKARVIQAIMEKEDELFAVYVEKQDANGNVQWFETVPNDHTFAANHKRRLESNEIFKSFVTASRRVADNSHGGPLPPQEPPPPKPTEGAVSAEAHYKLLKQLFAATDPCEQLTGSHELHVFINPENPNEYFPLTMPRANTWAEAIETANPPSSASSAAAPLSLLAQASLPTFPIPPPYSNQIFPGYYPFPIPHSQTTYAPPQAPEPAQPGTSLNMDAPGANMNSLPDFVNNSTLDNLLQFAHIEPEYSLVVKIDLVI
ncbi:hypothetical protein PCASD_20810 [Puccinia coronata f. sp. avenae]|uniref:Uncharacterized protein n=1 Tax=Puccinia coronata f. sp. avenae TaxID=200324 RepID=A0A2N5T2S6_9BASI|nr:hypothetical protein PCASD_20810 [Puccinia coronata f. sp. avenae]